MREGLAALNEEVKGSDGLRRCRWGSFLEGSGLSRGYTLIINSLPSYHLYHFFFTHCPSTHLGFITYNISNDPIKFLHKNQLLEIQLMKKQKSMSSSWNHARKVRKFWQSKTIHAKKHTMQANFLNKFIIQIKANKFKYLEISKKKKKVFRGCSSTKPMYCSWKLFLIRHASSTYGGCIRMLAS